MTARLPTGIQILDRKLDGGIPAGSIVSICADPASQSELLLYELTAERGTLYLTTQRSDQAVQDALDRCSTRVGSPTIKEVGGDAPLDHANRLIRALPEGANLIIDPVDVLEHEGEARFRNFLNDLQTHMVNTGSLAFLHSLTGRNVSPQRDTTEYMSDVIFTLDTQFDGEKVENRLAVPKFRGGGALVDTIKLELTETVSIDTSRDIA